MALARIESGRLSGLILPRTGEMPSSPQIEIPNPFIEAISAESLRHFAEGRGIDFPYTGTNPYIDYEKLCFLQKAQEAHEVYQKGKGNRIYFGPLLTDYIFQKKDFEGTHRPDFMGLDIITGELILAELDEVKTGEEYTFEARVKLDEEDGFYKLLSILENGNFLESRIKYALSGAISLPRRISSSQFIGIEGVSVLFMSPTSQKGRAVFERPGVFHQIVDMPSELKTAIKEEQARQRAVAEQRKREKAELKAKQKAA